LRGRGGRTQTEDQKTADYPVVLLLEALQIQPSSENENHPLVTLPKETLGIVLSFVPFFWRNVFQRVCRRFYHKLRPWIPSLPTFSTTMSRFTRGYTTYSRATVSFTPSPKKDADAFQLVLVTQAEINHRKKK